MNDVLEFDYGASRFSARVEFSDRKTLGISVLPDCTIVATAPTGTSPELITEKLEKRARWIRKQISYFEQFLPRTPERKYLSGETHLYLGRHYRLKFSEAPTKSLKLKGRYFIASGPEMTPASAKRLMKTWYFEKAQVIFRRRLAECMFRFPDIQTPEIVIRNMTRRWGSMSGKSTLVLNQDLIRAPTECIDYVLVHELCHIKESNHSPKFWNLLGKKYPTWRSAKNKLELKMK